MKEKIFGGVVGGLVAIGHYLFGEWTAMLETLLILIGIDIVTGWISGAYLGKLSSKVSFKGILKKILILVMVVLGHRLDMAGMEEVIQSVIGFELESPAMTLIILFYLGNEGLSICENVFKVIPGPSWLTKLFESLKDKGDSK